MKYFIRYSGCNMPKNKLQQAAVGLFKSLDGVVFNDNGKVINSIYESINEINKLYNRCKPLILKKWDFDGRGFCIDFDGDWLCRLYCHEVRKIIK